MQINKSKQSRKKASYKKDHFADKQKEIDKGRDRDAYMGNRLSIETTDHISGDEASDLGVNFGEGFNDE